MFKLLSKLYDCIHGSQDPSNKQWVKMRHQKSKTKDDMQWDFQAAQNYMKNNSLQYEDDSGKQRYCIKNVIMKGRHQLLGYFNTFLLSNT
eukprot:15345602-Ditylum_brightwellii.AAC.1